MDAGQSRAPADILGDDPQMEFPRSLFLPGGMGLLSSTSVTLMSDGSQRGRSPEYGRSPGIDSVTVMALPRTSSTPGQMCAVELDFPRASVLPGKSCAETWDYIKPTWLAGSPVCAWTVTGSLLFGSPHGYVRGCFHSTLLGLVQFDRSEFSRCRQYLIPPWTLVWIVLVVVCLSYSVVAGSVMASSRSSEMDQAGPSSAASGAHYQERFWALH